MTQSSAVRVGACQPQWQPHRPFQSRVLLMARWFLTMLLGMSVGSAVSGQEPDTPADEDQAAIHDALRSLRDDAIAAINRGDIDSLLQHVHPDVVMTAPSIDPAGIVRRGREGVRSYYDSMMTGPERHANKLKVNLTVDDLSILYGGDTAIAWGSSLDTYDMVDGSKFTIPTRWSATLVQADDRWLIAEFHLSTDMFRNPILEAALRQTMWFSGITAGIGGLLVGLAIGWRMLGARRTPRKSA